MFSSFAFAATFCFAAGIIIVTMLAVRAGSDQTIAHVLYDAENPERSR